MSTCTVVCSKVLQRNNELPSCNDKSSTSTCPELTGTNVLVHQMISGSTATVVIRDRVFNNFANFEGDCAGIFHYLFLSNGE